MNEIIKVVFSLREIWERWQKVKNLGEPLVVQTYINISIQLVIFS